VSLRFECFELRAFGPFTATELALGGTAGGGLHIICGPNEAGKSSAQRAIGDFLFGIPPRSTDNQLHEHGDMRLAAVLVDERGQHHDLVRRKGTRSTLLGPDQEPVDEGLLDGLLGGMTRDVFESMFSITHESLVVGGKALLAADGNVGESLFSASLGATGLHALRSQLDREVRDLFRPRAFSSAVLQARAAFDSAQTELRELTLRAGTFIEHERQVKVATAARKPLVAEVGQVRTMQNARERLRTVIPLLATRSGILEEIDLLAGAPELPDDARERRLVAGEREAADRQAAQTAQERVEDLQQRIAEIELDTALLEREQTIRELHGRLANVREGACDLGRQTIKLEGATRLAQRALDQVRPDLDLDSARRLRLTGTQRATVERALERHAQLTALLDAATQSAQDAEDSVSGLTDELAAFDAPTDTATLVAAATAAHAEGQIEARIIDAAGELAGALDQLEAQLRQLEPAASVEALRAMRPPSPAAVNAFADERDDLDARSREVADGRDRLVKDLRDVDEDASRLALGTNVPTVEDLATVRQQRDDEWQELRGHLEGRVTTSASPDTFEGHLRQADDVADRLRTEAESVARMAELTVRRRRLDAEAIVLDQGEQELAGARAEHDRHWATAWEPAAIVPGSPHEMTDWLRDRQSIMERADAVAQRARNVEAERRTRDEHMQALQTLLTTLGHDLSAIPSLSGLLSLAQAQVAEAQAVRDEHDELTRDLRLARATAAKNREKADVHRSALERWNEEWAAIVVANGWPSDVSAHGARQVLEAVTELADHLHEIDQLTARVDGIRERLDTFDDDAAALIEAVTSELASWPVHDAVAELERRLSSAIVERVSRDTLEGALEAAGNELESANRSVVAATRELETLIALAGVATIDELPEAERRAARAAELHKQLPELERQITDTGHAPLHELIERAVGVDLDVLDAQSAEGEDEIARLEEQLRELDVHIGELGGERRKMECLRGAAGAAEHVEQRAAQLRELAERYVRLYLAAWALSEAIDAYRRAHKTPVLKRADALFAQLTCGWFQGLEVTFDEADEPALVGVRRTGEKVPVKLMSTGTREQLYLSLRLASLERHVELRGPMPVILDDVVLHSDPQRKTAILRALANLGERTQVITFTHDPQVVALAQHAIDPDRVTVHELGGNEITGAMQPVILAADVRAVLPARAA
jgi:uncharacterized protein YhaN